MESNGYRLQIWQPNYVIESDRPNALMMDPDQEDFYRSDEERLRLMGVRNLVRRTLERCCKIDYRARN